MRIMIIFLHCHCLTFYIKSLVKVKTDRSFMAAIQLHILCSSNGFQPKPSLKLSELQISKAKFRMDKFIHSIKQHPDRRQHADPYYLIHEVGDPIYGTILMFHGFAQTPKQCHLLAKYLFDNGFNIYQPCLAKHYLKNASINWPQVDLRAPWKETIRRRFLEDPQLVAGKHMPETALKMLLEFSPDMNDIVAAINKGERSPDFERFYHSNHIDYFKEAESRYEEIEALPGPKFTVGISMGGAVALHLAMSHPDSIRKVVAYAPLLKVLDDATRQLALAIGPLDVRDAGWDPQLQFTMGCLPAIDLCGNYVNECDLSSLADVSSCFLFTENEDSADLPTQQRFASRLKKQLSGKAKHLHYTYKRELGVPHAMVHPNEVPISNKLWKTMYQETFRFLTEGAIDEGQLKSSKQDSKLPLVADV